MGLATQYITGSAKDLSGLGHWLVCTLLSAQGDNYMGFLVTIPAKTPAHNFAVYMPNSANFLIQSMDLSAHRQPSSKT